MITLPTLADRTRVGEGRGRHARGTNDDAARLSGGFSVDRENQGESAVD